MYVHTPVLLGKALEFLSPVKPGTIYIDATLGEGGYSEAFLKAFPDITMIGIDRDPGIMERAKNRLSGFGSRIRFFNIWFDDFFSQYDSLAEPGPGRIIFDLGISRYHYEKSERGFSFSKEEPLDMRLDPENGISAADIVNTYAEEKLAGLFFTYGEERFSRRIASAIVEKRKQKAIGSAFELAKIITGAVPQSARYDKRIHPATRCFQALRIAVNSELERLESGIKAAFKVLEKGGRLLVVSYHSLEDRIVKRFFREKISECTCPPEWPICQCRGSAEAVKITGKPVQPLPEETASNPASRSAKLRVIEKIL